MHKITHTSVASIGAILFVALVMAACGSSGGSSSGGSSPASVAGPTSGFGLTQPTSPGGAKVSGGAVYFTEGSDATPNYIFPMYSPQVCSTTNNNQLMDMMYRPLYWYGDNYRPTVDSSYSVGQPPAFSHGDKSVTVKLKSWKWSDGEPVTSRDIVFWINMMKASPATEWCGYVPGYFPDNVVSVSAPDTSTVVFHLNKAYNPEWFLYSELSQVTPLPLAWDRTSLSQPAPTTDNGHLPDTTKAGAKAVYAFLDAQSKKLGTWATSPLWSVVDGPFKLQSFTSTGEVTLVPNLDYSGSPRPTISKLVELPFTSEAAIYNQIRSGGPSAITIGNVPSQYAPQLSTLAAEGYDLNRASSYSFNYFPLNLHNPTMGPIFTQLYFRQAFQHLIDQQGWVSAFLYHTAIPTYGPIPTVAAEPARQHVGDLDESVPVLGVGRQGAAERQRLEGRAGWDDHLREARDWCRRVRRADQGWSGDLVQHRLPVGHGRGPGRDERPGRPGQEGGINLQLTTHPFATVIGAAVACQPSRPTCKWTAQNWGAGWIYGPSYLPTGEQLYGAGAVANYGSYSDPATTKLIAATITGPGSQETQALTAYAKRIEEQVPVVFGPSSVGTYGGYAGTVVDKHLGGYAANSLGLMNPEDWYFTK